ncbi:hypothetical protein [Ideonella alba]|uniref:Uncharacterized protein n=1 Tax=Ideonella alba TaxID=2824118 RepID=A0A940YDM0_9BURK|nr:hypothetical protein [Ideonella alba]MBQ0930687.1 hypothetical protein [Ideonella alba]
MTLANYPDDLKLGTWEKKKGSLPTDGDLADRLKALLKMHTAIKWGLFDSGWVAEATTREQLEQAFAERDRQFRGTVFPLKKAALETATLAQRQSKEKGATELVVKSCKAVAAVANTLADEVDHGVDELKSVFEMALRKLPEAEPGADEPPALLLDPRKLAAQLLLCRKDPARRVAFAYVDGKEKQAAVLAMHPKQSSRSLFGKLSETTGVKAGAHGTAWVDEGTLFLQMDKPLGGLAKKVRSPLKACGFRVRSVVIWDESGQPTESDEDHDESAQDEVGLRPPTGEDGPQDSPEPSEPEPTPDQRAEGAFRLLLQTLEQRYEKALRSAPEAVGKLGALLEFGRKQGAAGEYLKGIAGLKKLDEMLLAAMGKEEAEWERRHEDAERQLQRALRQMPTVAGRLRAVLDLAEKRAGERQFVQALQALQQLDRLVDEVGEQREQESARLRKDFERWLPDPADVDDLAHLNLEALRQEARQALDGDVELARVLIEVLAQEWGRTEKAAAALKKERLLALQLALQELPDPPGLALLNNDPVAEARRALQSAIDRGAVEEAETALERLKQVIEQAIDAIAEETSRRINAFLDRVEKLTDPADLEEDERQRLAGLRSEALRLIAEGILAGLSDAVDALEGAVKEVEKAVAERRRLAEIALREAFERVVVPAGASTDELAPAEAPRLRVEQALREHQPVPGQQALREYVLALRKVAREVARRLKAERPPETLEETPAIEQDRQRSRELRAWIETHIYIPNASIKDSIGRLVSVDDADDAFDQDALSQEQYDDLMRRLVDGDQTRIEDTQRRIETLRDPTSQLTTLKENLAKSIRLCEPLKTMAAPKTPPGWSDPDMAKLVHQPADRHLQALRAAALAVDNALAGLSDDIDKPDGVSAAQAVLLTHTATRRAYLDWRKTLSRDDSDGGPAALLECARVAVDNGLRVKVAQSRLNVAKQNKQVGLAMLKAQLDADYEAQAVIKVEDQLKVLGRSGRFSALPQFQGLNLHLSLFEGVYKGGQRWPAGTPKDLNNAARQNKILDALIGSERGGIHVTLEWTGEQDNECNLKCYRAGTGAGTDVMWNAAKDAYGNYAAGKTAKNGALRNGFRSAPDTGANYPTETTVKTHLALTLNNIIATMRTRIVEMCANRGLTNAERTSNTRDLIE